MPARFTYITLSALVFILAAHSPAPGQRRVSGRIITTDSLPVVNAFVVLKAGSGSAPPMNTLTDQNGEFSFQLTGAEITDRLPERTRLLPSYPNPFHDETVIPFEVSAPSMARLEIFDVLGRSVRLLDDGYVPQGRHLRTWDGADGNGTRLPPGLYFAALSTAQSCFVSRIALSGAGTAPTFLPPNGCRESVEFRAEADAVEMTLDVLDTSIASPRFYSIHGLKLHVVADTLVTLIVYGDNNWSFEGLSGDFVARLYHHNGILYACLRKHGLAYTSTSSTPLVWTFKEAPISTNGDVLDVLEDETSPGHLMIAARSLSAFQSWVYTSCDQGSSWISSDSGLKDQGGYYSEIDRIQLAGNRIIAGGGGVFISTDFGGIWSNTPGSGGMVMERHKTLINIICCGGINIIGNQVFWLSSDTGSSWRQVEDFGPDIYPVGSITAIGITNDSSFNIYLPLNQGVCRTADSGRTWSEPLQQFSWWIPCIMDDGVDVWTGGKYLSRSFRKTDYFHIVDTPFTPACTIIHMLHDDVNRCTWFGTTNGVYKLQY